MTSLRALCGAVAGAVLVAGTSAAMAQAWPTRAMQVISPFTAGNANDIVARIVLDQVSKQIGQSFVIENRPGGGGSLGAAFVAKADPDGYTFLLHSSSLSSQVVLHKTLPYDPVRDFTPVILYGIQPSVLVAAPSKGFKTVADLVAAAKAKPGSMNFASAGIGSASHMAGERFRLATGIDVQHIPFRGPVEAFTDVMAGRIDYYFLPIAPALPVVQQGQVVALAVSTPTRAPALPDVPTVAESGYPNARIPVLGRVVRAGENAAPNRRQAARRIPEGPRHAGRPGTAGEGRRAAAADERGADRQVLPRRPCGDDQARQGREHRADELIGSISGFGGRPPRDRDGEDDE